MSRGRRKPPLRPDHGCSARNSRDSDYNLASPGRGESKMAAGGRVVLLAVGWLRGWLTGWSTSSGRRGDGKGAGDSGGAGDGGGGGGGGGGSGR